MTNVTDGLRVKTAWGNTGTVIDIDMHKGGFTDVLVELDDGKLTWFSHRDLTPEDAESELKVIGRCYICQREVTRDNLARKENAIEPEVQYFRGWPGDGFACVEHPGVREAYQEEIDKANIALTARKDKGE